MELNMIVRNNQVEHIWQVQYEKSRFQYYIYIKGTEDEMREYMESEMGFVGRYSALSEKEKEALHTLRAKVYIAPQWLKN